MYWTHIVAGDTVLFSFILLEYLFERDMFTYRYFHPAQIENGIIGYKKLLNFKTNVNLVCFCFHICFFSSDSTLLLCIKKNCDKNNLRKSPQRCWKINKLTIEKHLICTLICYPSHSILRFKISSLFNLITLHEKTFIFPVFIFIQMLLTFWHFFSPFHSFLLWYFQY